MTVLNRYQKEIKQKIMEIKQRMMEIIEQRIRENKQSMEGD
jgi:hypothetical protein